MNKNKQLVINMAASFVAYAVTFGINFFLSPYIVKNVGVDAYGFVGLANNFVSYAGIITIALNALAGRFVTVKLYEKDIQGANVYFSSVFIADLILSIFMGICGLAVVVFLEKLINIPGDLYIDVKLLFSYLFANCLISTLGTVFSIATFATNKLYINSIRQIESNLLRLCTVVPLFMFFTPRVSYLGAAALVMGLYVFIFNIYYTKKLLPDIHIKIKYFNMRAILTILTSGIWNLIVRLGQLLLDGLDLLISNIFIDAVSMGILSVAKTVPSIISGIVGNLVGIFSPNFTILFAERKLDELRRSLKQSMKIMGILANAPIIILIICGERFYELWQPTQDARQLYILSVLSCSALIFNGGINCIYDIFTVVNKLKWNAIAVCVTGGVSTLLVYILVKTTSLGLLAVAGVSSAVATVKNLVFTVPYGAHCLGLKWYAFYSDVIRPVIFVAVSSCIGIAVESVLAVDGWCGLLLLGAISMAIIVAVGWGIILNKRDRQLILDRLRRRK